MIFLFTSLVNDLRIIFFNIKTFEKTQKNKSEITENLIKEIFNIKENLQYFENYIISNFFLSKNYKEKILIKKTHFHLDLEIIKTSPDTDNIFNFLLDENLFYTFYQTKDIFKKFIHKNFKTFLNDIENIKSIGKINDLYMSQKIEKICSKKDYPKFLESQNVENSQSQDVSIYPINNFNLNNSMKFLSKKFLNFTIIGKNSSYYSEDEEINSFNSSIERIFLKEIYRENILNEKDRFDLKYNNSLCLNFSRCVMNVIKKPESEINLLILLIKNKVEEKSEFLQIFLYFQKILFLFIKKYFIFEGSQEKLNNFAMILKKKEIKDYSNFLLNKNTTISSDLFYELIYIYKLLVDEYPEVNSTELFNLIFPIYENYINYFDEKVTKLKFYLIIMELKWKLRMINKENLKEDLDEVLENMLEFFFKFLLKYLFFIFLLY